MNSFLTQVGPENLNPNELQPSLNRRRRRSIESTPDSEESYVPPKTRKRIVNTSILKTSNTEVIVPTHQINESSFEKVKILLTRYSTKLKYQRYPDSRTNISPCFETEAYYNLQAERAEEDDELFSKFFIDIKESLALAYETTASANVHHFLRLLTIPFSMI